jgi:NADPH:quinone reductase-like Zn-dependent oxidoreductase
MSVASLARLIKPVAPLRTARPLSAFVNYPPVELFYSSVTRGNRQLAKMHVALVKVWGEIPKYEEVPDLPAPAEGQIRLRILGTAMHRIVGLRASGKHPTARPLPSDPFADGVGLDETTGTAYYITTFAAPTSADYANVDTKKVVPLPAGADPIPVAALVNPVQSSWMALATRVVVPKEGWTALILGATSTSGKAAIQVVKRFGATKVIGAARDQKGLDALSDLDQRIVINNEDASRTDFSSLGHVDIILDFVYGPVTTTLFKGLDAPPDREVQYCNIGFVSGTDAEPLSAMMLRNKALRITGAGPGAWSMAQLGRHVGEIVSFVATMERPSEAVQVPLRDIGKMWESQDAKKKRLVFVP